MLLSDYCTTLKIPHIKEKVKLTKKVIEKMSIKRRNKYQKYHNIGYFLMSNLDGILKR